MFADSAGSGPGTWSGRSRTRGLILRLVARLGHFSFGAALTSLDPLSSLGFKCINRRTGTIGSSPQSVTSISWITVMNLMFRYGRVCLPVASVTFEA